MERTELVEAVDFLINTGTLNQLIEVAVNEAKKQPDDWRSRTCGECGYALPVKAMPERSMCRRSAGGSFNWPVVCNDDKACPAFVARESATHAASIAAGKE